jgi:dUTP pyrophosphatase
MVCFFSMGGVSVPIKKLVSDAKVPSYAHPGDAGLDLYSVEDTVIEVGEARMLRTGISMAIPEGFVGLIWSKSGLAAKHSVISIGGVVDSGYRGEITVVLKNLGTERFMVTKHMKIAQMLIQPVCKTDIVESDMLSETSRSNGGFGSTGLH